MARLVKHEATGPQEVKAQESVWICRCGLSKSQPFCDGSHHRTRDEKLGALYVYDETGRREVEEP